MTKVHPGLVAAVGMWSMALGFGSILVAADRPLVAVVSSATQAAANEYCPVMPKTKAEADLWLDYQGQRIYFCHELCKTRFLGNPEKYLKYLPPTMVKAMDHGSHPLPPGPADQEVAAHGHGHTHDHPTSAGVSSSAQRLGRFLGRFHPMAVHLPIGMLIAAAIAELLLMWRGQAWFAATGRFCVLLGALAAPVTATLGWLAAAGASYGGELASVLETHRWMGTATASLAIFLAIVSEWSRRKTSLGRLVVYRGLLFLTFAVVGVTGHLGGTLVYGHDWLTP